MNSGLRAYVAAAVAAAALALCAPLAAQEGARPRAAAHPVLPIGAPAPDFALRGVDGRIHRLSDFAASPILMVMFICNHCPTSQLYETRMKKLVEDYRPKGVAAVAISPNDPNAVMLSELGYTDVNDGFEDMKIRAAYRRFNFPYLYDGDTQSVAEAYGPAATPHIFIFDRERKLRYEGRIDNSQRESLVKTQDARAALDALLAGRPVPVASTRAVGCSTKWKSKSEGRLKEKQAIEAEPVRLEKVTAEGLKQLRANAGDKVLLVSFWATWCGPCLTEFPQIQETWRMYRRRNFELVTVSTNLPDEAEGVMKVLRQEHASSRNLQFATADTDALQEAFEPSWKGAVPFTMVLAPGGKVLFQQQGEVDVLALRRVILAHLDSSTYIGHSAYWATR